MLPRLKSIELEGPGPALAFPHLFYWIHFSQSFVKDLFDLQYSEERRTNGFESFKAFGDDDDPANLSHVIAPESLKYKRNCYRTSCCGDEIHVGIDGDIDFSICEYDEIPWVYNLQGAGGGVCHEKVARTLQHGEFKGLVEVSNQNSARQTVSEKYIALTARSFVTQIHCRFREDDGNFCPQCGFQPIRCTDCSRNRCRDCFWKSATVPERWMNRDWTDYNPVLLSSWNGDDLVCGESDTLVTGRLLRFLIDEQLTPFGYGPMATEAKGAKRWQLDSAEKAKCEIRIGADK